MTRLRFADVFAAMIALALTPGSARADDNAWTGASNFNWSTVDGNNNWALFPNSWANGFFDCAFFNGSAPGTITATTPITLRGMSFNANGYTIAGSGADPLTLTAGSSGSLQNGEIQVGTGFTANVNATLAGTVGMTKTGLGTLLLGGANTYSGGTNINAGILSIPTIANGGVASPIGAASNAPANIQLGGGVIGGDGTLRYTGPTTSTDRGVTLVSAAFGSTIDVATAATVLTMSGQFTGAGALTKAGAGTLVLTNKANNYANGTVINAGTLAVGANSAVLPAGNNVTVNSGATFNYGNGSTTTNNGSAIGALTLNNGTYRLSGGAGDFYLNQLVIGNTGGTLDFTGATDFYTHFTGAGAGITVNANSVWTGSGTSSFQNDTGALLPITINSSSTVTNSVRMIGLSVSGYRLLGGGNGTMFLSNPTSTNTADFRVEAAYLRVDNMADLGTGAVTLAGAVMSAGNADTLARLWYSGATATSAKPLTLDASGGDIWVSTTGTTLTLTGVIGETGGTGRALSVYGDSGSGTVLTLTAANTYTGPTAVNNGGILSIPTIANGGVASPIGAASNAPANLQLGAGTFGGDGTLRYTGPTASTGRGVTLVSDAYNSTIDVATAATVLTMSGQFTGSGALTKAGAGTLVLTNKANNYANGTVINAGTLAVGANSAVLPAGNNVTVNSGATFNYGNGSTTTNNGSAIGALILNNGTYRLSGGTGGDFYLNQLYIGSTGGTLDFTGAPDFNTHFTGAGAGIPAITINANSVWTGSGTSSFQNDTGALLPITMENGSTVTSSVSMIGSGSAGYRLLGGNGTMFLSNPTSANTADFRVEAAYLGVADMTYLGSGAITLAGSLISAGNVDTSARLEYTGATATSAKPLTLDASGGSIWVSTTGTTLTLTGVIGETGGTGRALTVYGDNASGSTLVLTAANTYTGPTAVNNGAILSIPTIANGGVASPIGAASNAPANIQLGGGVIGGDGTLRYTGPTTSTDRGVTFVSASNNATIDVATAATVLTMSGQFTGAGALTKAGAGTLVLTNNTNHYINGTIVNAGTLAVGANGTVLPANKNVTVNSGATFNYGNGVGLNNSGSAIGTLTLNNGTYRLSGGAGDFYLNRLVIGDTGGTLDFTGAPSFFTHFKDTGAGITVNAFSTWTGSGTSHIQNDTGALLPITMENGSTVTSSVSMIGSGSAGFRLLGGSGALFLSNPTSANSADFRVEAAYLGVADMTYLGSGAITLAGSVITAGNADTFARLWYTGLTATTAKPLTLDSAGGDIYVSHTGTTLTFNGVISEMGGSGRALTVNGDLGSGTVLALTAANTYTGPTAVNYGGILSIPTIANGGVASPIGASSNAPANLQLGGGNYGGAGTLRYTGPTAGTNRGVTLTSAIYNSTIDVATAATVLTMSGKFTGAGALTKAGAGTLVLTNNTNNYANGTNVNAGTLTIAVGGSMPDGIVTVAPLATLNVNGSIASTATVNDNGTTNFAGNTSIALPLNRALTALNIGNAALATVNLSASTLFPEILSPTTLTLTGTGKLDLTNNELTTTATPSSIRAGLGSGAIFTSHAGGGTSLGYIDIGGGSTEVRYTLLGDTNLDGTVNVTDLGNLATNFGSTSATWIQGDFDYNGTVNVADLGDLATNFGQSLGAGSSAEMSAVPALSGAAVPEPALLGVVTCSLILPLRRRRNIR